MENMQQNIPNQVPDKKEEIKEIEEEIVPNATNIKTQETFTLPSMGLIYPNGNPKSITLRRMTVREDRLRMRNESESMIRKNILQACTLDQGVDIGQLALFDVNYLLFCLRRISLLNNMYKVKLICPHCESEFIDEIDLSKVKIKYASKDNLPNFNIELPISKARVTLKFPTLSSIILFADNISEYTKMNPNEDTGELFYAYGDIIYIAGLNGKTAIFEELEDFIDTLDIVDLKYLKAQVKKLDNVYGVDDDIICQCPNCKLDVHHGLPITSELFTPSL